MWRRQLIAPKGMFGACSSNTLSSYMSIEILTCQKICKSGLWQSQQKKNFVLREIVALQGLMLGFRDEREQESP